MKIPFLKGKSNNEVKSKVIALSKFKETPLRRKVLVYITKREADGLHVIRKVKTKEPVTEVVWQNHTYLVRPENVSYYEKGLPVYIFEYENSLPLTFQLDKESLKSDYVFQLFNKQILRQLISSINKTKALDLMTLAIGAVMGLAFGVIIGIYVAPHMYPAMGTTTSTTSTVTTAPNPFSK